MPTTLSVYDAKAKLRSLAPDPAFAGKVKVNCDLFADDSSLWEACHEVVAADHRFGQYGVDVLK